MLPQPELLDLLIATEAELPPTDELVVPSRTVHLPLSWDDPATREAIARYMAGVRDDAPWCPWNIEFIRRVNGLDVGSTTSTARSSTPSTWSWAWATSIWAPRSPPRWTRGTGWSPPSTTRPRTWTAENSVGIGGAYLCVYGMEGPGGYQFVGRTTQVWSGWQQRGAFEQGKPWLLRFFDRIKWYPVDADELLDAARRHGRPAASRRGSRRARSRWPSTRPSSPRHAASIAEFRARQQSAFAAERDAWEAAGEFARAEQPADTGRGPARRSSPSRRAGACVEAEFAASVWQVARRARRPRHAPVSRCSTLEAMKMESRVHAPEDAVVTRVLTAPGAQLEAGTPLLMLSPAHPAPGDAPAPRRTQPSLRAV